VCFVVLFILHGKRMHRMILSCHLCPLWIYHISPHYLRNCTIFWRKKIIEYEVCGEHRALDHPRSQDSLSSIHPSLINTDSSCELSGNCKSQCVMRFRCSSKQAAGIDSVDTRRSSVACTYNCACACVSCVLGNTYLYHHKYKFWFSLKICLGNFSFYEGFSDVLS